MANTLIFGGSVGSEGKGAIVGYLARRQKWDAAICTFMTNAGHTWIGDNGENVVVQQLPMALVGPDVKFLLIAPGSAITLDQLEKEINKFERDHWNVANRLRIHPRAMIIEQEDVDYEKEGTKYLASTSKGCGSALARKVMRKPSVRLARDVHWLRPFLHDTTELVNEIANNGGEILIEGSQGFDLDINHGIEYPFCTSRGTTPQQTLADCGLSERLVREVIAVIRSFPIRVGNVVTDGVQEGHSGPFGGRELTWEEITQRSGSPVPLLERTTVTQRVRRIFELDHKRLQYMVNVCRPTSIALTFADYIDYSLRGVSTQTVKNFRLANPEARPLQSYPKLEEFMGGIDAAINNIPPSPLINLVKTGPRDGDIINLDEV